MTSGEPSAVYYNTHWRGSHVCVSGIIASYWLGRSEQLLILPCYQ